MNNNERLTAVNYSQRLARERMWINSLYSLQSEVSEPVKPLIREGVEFLEQQTAPGEPLVSEDGEHYGVRRPNNKIGFVALFHADAALHPYFQNYINNQRYSYLEDFRSIIVPPQQLSKRWRGILMFHELLHAKYHQENTFRDLEDPHYTEEQSVYQDEHLVIEDLYGQKYVDYVERLSPQIGTRIQNGRLERGELSAAASVVLEEVINDTPYKHEVNFRRGALMTHLAYRTLQLIGRDTADDRAKFTRSLEKEGSKTVWFGSEEEL